MLASCSRSTLRRTQNRICIATAHSTNIPAHRHASTATRPTTPRDGSNIPPGPRGGNGNTRSTPVPTPSRIRNEPWSFTPDHSFQSTHHQSAIARYQLRMSKEAEQGNFINCLKLCRDMKKSGVKPSLMLYNDVLKAGAHEGLYLEVEGILDDMRASGIEPDRQSYHHLLSAKRHLPSKDMWTTIEEMRTLGIYPDAKTYALILERPFVNENVEMIIQYVAEMMQRGITPELDTAQRAIIIATNYNLPKLALELAHAFEHDSVRRLDIEVWMNCLICAAENLYADGVLEAWQKVVIDLGITPDEGCLNQVLYTAARHGLPDLGTDALRVLQQIGATPREHHCAALISAFCRADQLYEAFETLNLMRHGKNKVQIVAGTTQPIFDYMKKDVERIDSMWGILDKLKGSGQRVDIAAINVIIQASVFFGDIQRAVGTYKVISEYGLSATVETYNLLLSACIGAAHRGLGDHLLGEMKKAGIKPDARTYERLVLLCLTQDTYEDAFFYLEEMKGHKLLPTYGIYDAIIRKCVSVGDTRFKLALDEMKQVGYQASNSLNKFIIEGGDFVATVEDAQSEPIGAPEQPQIESSSSSPT